jgi:protein-tyrosine-phosphatase
MQKKKFNKAPKVSKFDTNELSNMVFDSIFDMEHNTTKETVGQMVSSTMTTAIELLKIVIENKVRNAEQITDKDIYDIYKKSFSAIIKAASMVDDE